MVEEKQPADAALLGKPDCVLHRRMTQKGALGKLLRRVLRFLDEEVDAARLGLLSA